MSHYVQIIIAENSIIDSIEADWVHGNKLNLSQGFSLIPMITQLFDDINELDNTGKSDSFDEFEFLSSSIEGLLKSKSYKSKVAYVETEYFGGTGVQCGILFENQKIKIGPLRTETIWDERSNSYRQIPEGKGAINTVLKELGVSDFNAKDEFDSLGLGNFRSNEKIVDSIK